MIPETVMYFLESVTTLEALHKGPYVHFKHVDFFLYYDKFFYNKIVIFLMFEMVIPKITNFLTKNLLKMFVISIEIR